MNRNFLLAIVCSWAALLAGCKNPPVKVDRVADPRDYKWVGIEGTTTISGDVGGDVKTAAGLPVYLDALTLYSADVFKALVEHGPFEAEKESETIVFDPVMLESRRRVIADSSGHFRFEKVGAGDYFVSCYVRWLKPDGWYEGYWKAKRIRVRDGQADLNLAL